MGLGGEQLFSLISWPIFMPIAFVKGYRKFSLPFTAGMTFAIVVTALYWIATRGWWRKLAPSVAVLSFAIAFVDTGEWQFKSELSRTATALKPICLSPGTFMDSLAHAGNHWLLHAAAIKDGKLYGWSFAKKDFYQVPLSAIWNVDPPSKSWYALPYDYCRWKRPGANPLGK
jgi:hypothetical protein